MSAEMLTGEEWSERKFIEKSENARKHIQSYFPQCYLLRDLTEEQSEAVIDAMEEISLAAGNIIIGQGDFGDYFYILEEGEAEASMLKQGAYKPKLMRKYSAGDFFGELALLYNAPRAATVQATTDCILWALDRFSFKAILTSTTLKKTNIYEEFLKEVPILEPLDQYQRSAIADVLEPEGFEPNECIIEEGQRGDKFYILEEGEAAATTTEKLLAIYKRGDFFGELALLNDAPRSATVTALTKCKTVSINRDQFKAMVEVYFIYQRGLTTRISHANVYEALKLLKLLH